MAALARYVLTSTVTVAAGTITTPIVAGEPGTGGAAGFGNTSISAGSDYAARTFLQGTVIMLDSAGAVYGAIGAGNLRAFVDGQDTVGHASLGN